MKKLNPRQQLFCEIFTSDKEFFGNGVMSYAEAYNIDLDVTGAYNTAKSNAQKLLTKPYILEYINSLLEERTLNDAFIDKQLAFLATQNADFGTKMRAIQEYNKLKQRIASKLDLTSGGEKIEAIKVVFAEVGMPSKDGVDSSLTTFEKVVRDGNDEEKGEDDGKDA